MFMPPKLTFAVIGDSAAYGTGDFDEAGAPRGWAYYLKENFREEVNYFNFSRPGAKSSEVRNVQLPMAMEVEPDICAVIVGGNDLLRNGFDPDELHKNLTSTCADLLLRGSEILMVQLHDPGQLLRIPRLLKRVLRRRVDSVNAVYEKVASELDVILIRTREIPDVHDLRNWHIDRMHPGPFGHQILAREMAAQLRTRGWNISLPLVKEQKCTGEIAKVVWLIRNGLPWFLKRSVDLLPVALILMALELIQICRELVSQNR
ncbi:MAG: GDSL-type esterase/lipase family protein [Actinomycetes bacterium]